MPKHLLTFCLLLFLASCRTYSAWSPDERQAVAKEVQTVLENYHHAINKQGLIGELPYLDSSSDFFWVPPGYATAIDYDSVVHFIRRNAPAFTLIDNSFDTLVAIPLSREIATYTARIRSLMKDTTGGISSVTLIETGNLIKRRDGWKLLNGQTAVVEPQKVP